MHRWKLQSLRPVVAVGEAAPSWGGGGARGRWVLGPGGRSSGPATRSNPGSGADRGIGGTTRGRVAPFFNFPTRKTPQDQVGGTRVGGVKGTSRCVVVPLRGSAVEDGIGPPAMWADDGTREGQDGRGWGGGGGERLGASNNPLGRGEGERVGGDGDATGKREKQQSAREGGGGKRRNLIQEVDNKLGIDAAIVDLDQDAFGLLRFFP